MSSKNYTFSADYLTASEPVKFKSSDLLSEEMLINIGPQHPSTHGVLRLEVITDGELVKEVVPHMGYLHRCFEKHAESVPFNQAIPFVDRLDYLAAMNSELAWAMGLEQMLGIDKEIPKRIEYIRVLVAELNRLSSHFIAIGTYGIDIGAATPFLWLFRDREVIMRMLEWLSGARMLYNYIWIGGLFYDLPVGFEEKCEEFTAYLKPKLDELQSILISNHIFIQRTANVGILPLEMAVNYGCTGPVLRGSGLKYDLRKIDGYGVYPEIEFDVPVGEGLVGTTGDCWDRNYVRVQECYQSLRIIDQCIEKLKKEHKRDRSFDPQAMVPKKIRPKAMDFYVRAENPKGELGFFFKTDGKSDIPLRSKVRACSFNNLSILPELAKGLLIADLMAIMGSIDVVMGEVDR